MGRRLLSAFMGLSLLVSCLTACASTGETGPQGSKGDTGETGPQGPAGQDGKDGTSIISIVKTSSEGNVDTYTITFSDGSRTTFTVTNGRDGNQGIQGEPGEDGHTPTIEIGQNGDWIIDGIDTGVPATGENGRDGIDGNTVLTGTGAPNSIIGSEGDSYINLECFDFYVKENGNWVLKGNLKGPSGENGHDGINGRDGSDGKNGENGSSVFTGSGIPPVSLGADGDSYIDVDIFDFYSKVDGEWSKVGSIRGQDAWNYGLYYTVNFELNGGVMPDGYEETVEVQAMSILMLPEPLRVGYVFAGWFTGESVNDGQFFNYTAIACDLTLYARWNPGDFKISFDLNGGEGTIDPLPVKYDAGYFLEEPTRTGYTFSSWTYNGQTIPNEGVWKIALDIELVATWTANQYMITLDAGEGVVSKNSISVEFDSSYLLPSATRSGYSFLGWYLGEDLFLSVGTYVLASDVTLTAKWSEPIEYSISYIAPSADLPSNPKTYNVTDSFTLELPTDEYGHSYKWYTNSSFTGNEVSVFIGSNYLKDVILWAKPIHTTATTTTLTQGHYAVVSKCSKCGGEEVDKPYRVSGSTYYFGAYPQSKVTDDSLISTLNASVGSLPTSSSTMGWIDYHFYDCAVQTNYESFYKDIPYGGQLYRAFYKLEHRASHSGTYGAFLKPTNPNGYATKTVYWFKWEPIRWNRLTSSSGKVLLMSEICLDNQHYNMAGSTTDGGVTYTACAYKYSQIRTWLTSTFYSDCFIATERTAIETTSVDNSKAVSSSNSIGVTTSAYTDPTLDKIFLPSYLDLRTSSYGFKATDNELDARKAAYSDYYLALSGSNSDGYGKYWSRSPNSTGGGVHAVTNGGEIFYYSVSYNIGVRPMLWLSL